MRASFAVCVSAWVLTTFPPSLVCACVHAYVCSVYVEWMRSRTVAALLCCFVTARCVLLAVIRCLESSRLEGCWALKSWSRNVDGGVKSPPPIINHREPIVHLSASVLALPTHTHNGNL